MSKISIIIPTLNEAEYIEQSLVSVQSFRSVGHEVIVVDGGSNDNTVQIASKLVDHIFIHSPGRAIQMNAGAHMATGDIYLFLHADTILPANAGQIIQSCLQSKTEFWGRFNVTLTGQHWLFRIIEYCMNIRTRITGIVTGDHAIFISKKLFKKINGFPEIELMEDIAISQKLKNISRPVCINDSVLTSSRRWEQRGILKTVIQMWWIRFKYHFGADPINLARQYD